MTTWRYFRMLRSRNRDESLTGSQSSEDGTVQKDPLTLAMITLILFSLAVRLFFEVPLQIYWYFEGSKSASTI